MLEVTVGHDTTNMYCPPKTKDVQSIENHVPLSPNVFTHMFVPKTTSRSKVAKVGGAYCIFHGSTVPDVCGLKFQEKYFLQKKFR